MSDFKRSYAMVGSSGNDHSIVVDDRGGRFGCFLPLFPLLVLHKLRRTGRETRLVGFSNLGACFWKNPIFGYGS